MVDRIRSAGGCTVNDYVRGSNGLWHKAYILRLGACGRSVEANSSSRCNNHGHRCCIGAKRPLELALSSRDRTGITGTIENSALCLVDRNGKRQREARSLPIQPLYSAANLEASLKERRIVVDAHGHLSGVRIGTCGCVGEVAEDLVCDLAR